MAAPTRLVPARVPCDEPPASVSELARDKAAALLDAYLDRSRAVARDAASSTCAGQHPRCRAYARHVVRVTYRPAVVLDAVLAEPQAQRGRRRARLGEAAAGVG